SSHAANTATAAARSIAPRLIDTADASRGCRGCLAVYSFRRRPVRHSDTATATATRPVTEATITARTGNASTGAAMLGVAACGAAIDADWRPRVTARLAARVMSSSALP